MCHSCSGLLVGGNGCHLVPSAPRDPGQGGFYPWTLQEVWAMNCVKTPHGHSLGWVSSRGFLGEAPSLPELGGVRWCSAPGD